MTQNKFITAAVSTSLSTVFKCTVPNTYREKIPEQNHPSCGFYAAAYALNCFNPDAEWTNIKLFDLAHTYPLDDNREGILSEVGEVFHPCDFACFINWVAEGSCSATCQLFREQDIWSTIDQGGYVLVPFQVINDKQNEKYGFPRTNVQETDGAHAHWCVIAGYATTDNSKLLAKHWGKKPFI